MDPNKPSPTELSVLKGLWKRSPLSAREIHEAVSPELQWSYSSTRKTLERMEEKGFVSSSQAHGIRIFKAQAKKTRVIAAFIRDFEGRVLELEAPLPASVFASSKLLDEHEIEDLETQLDKIHRQ